MSTTNELRQTTATDGWNRDALDARLAAAGADEGEAWERKREWYAAQGYADRLIISQDGPDGGIDAEEIERIARARILSGGG